MQVWVNIGSPVEPKTSKAGRPYYEFRAAENHGSAEKGNESTDWYTVRAFIPEHEADLLGKGVFVRVEGKLNTDVYFKKEDTAKANPQVARTVLAFKVERIEKGSGGNGAGRQQQQPQQQRVAAPAGQHEGGYNGAATGGVSPGGRSYDDFEDDIPF